MSKSYANILDETEQYLQDTSNATYDTTELGYWIEMEIAAISRWRPLIIPVEFTVESRRGTDTTGTASSLTDTVKSQFLSTDPTNEKVVHNTTDDTWATITSYTSTSVVGLNRDIMDANESYEIYNKRCWNKRQIYLGSMPPYLWIDSVEYPIGKRRNFHLYDDVLELDVYDSVIADSDSTLSNLGKTKVLVRFAVKQILCQLTDLAGEITNGAGYAEGISTVNIDGMGNTETIEVGDQFNLENHRSLYIVTTGATTSSNAATISFYPPLEAAVVDNDDITFRKSTLTPDLEEILIRRLAARAVLGNTIVNINAIPEGGPNTYSKEQQYAINLLVDTENELRSYVESKPYRTLPRS